VLRGEKIVQLQAKRTGYRMNIAAAKASDQDPAVVSLKNR
jgi:chorismate mutase